jgi:glycyl-tRNA synthetase beta chain
VSIADRLDTLVGCFAIGLSPTGATDPYGLRRACLGVLRTLLDRGFDLRLSDAFQVAYDGYGGVSLDAGPGELFDKLSDFFAERLRGLLSDKLPADAVLAALGVAGDRPIDVRARASAIAELDAATRAGVGEVFKRATNIAAGAPLGEPSPPRAEDHPSEIKVYDGYVTLRERLAAQRREGNYGAALREIANFAPLLHQYFLDVYVMVDDIAVRENRLRLMRTIAETCATVAKLELLGERKE